MRRRDGRWNVTVNVDEQHTQKSSRSERASEIRRNRKGSKTCNPSSFTPLFLCSDDWNSKEVAYRFLSLL